MPTSSIYSHVKHPLEEFDALTPLAPKNLCPPPLNTHRQTPLQKLHVHAIKVLAPRSIALHNLIQRQHRALLPRPLHPLFENNRPFFRSPPVDPAFPAFSSLFCRFGHRLFGRGYPLCSVLSLGRRHPADDGARIAQGKTAGEGGVGEERGLQGVDEGYRPEAVMSAVGLDEERPGRQLRGSSGEDGLECEERRERVVGWELEVSCCGLGRWL